MSEKVSGGAGELTQFGETRPEEGFYVYLLTDPNTGKVFYVGKGQGYRALTHMRDARNGHVDNVGKYQAIRAIQKQGLEPRVLYRPAESEREALRLERRLISQLKDQGITNMVDGTTPMQERVAARAQHNLETMKTRERWKREISAELEASVVRIYGSLDACYDHIRGEFLELSKIADS